MGCIIDSRVYSETAIKGNSAAGTVTIPRIMSKSLK